MSHLLVKRVATGDYKKDIICIRLKSIHFIFHLILLPYNKLNHQTVKNKNLPIVREESGGHTSTEDCESQLELGLIN